MMPVHQFPESDCKTSPLALLVQICSNIGAEKPTPKSSSSDKNNSSSANGNNSSSSSSSNSSSDEIRVTKDKDTPCSPANSVHSASSLTSSSARTPREEPTTKRSTPSECRSSPHQRRPTPDLPQRPKSKTPVSSSSHEATPTSTSEPTYSSSSSIDFNGSSSLGKAVNGLNPLALANCSGCSPVAGHIPLEAAYPKGAYSFGSAAALSPYMNYGRHKGGSFVPVCRDPYCSNCQLAAQLPYGPDRLAMSGLYPGLPGYPVVPGFASPGSFASPPRGAIVCNWMLGDTFCGKRFSTSEELLQHLRTHASLLGSGSLPLYSPASLPLTMDGLYGSPSLTTPAGLRRTYPTSLSPVSSLSAAGRYHPYKPPGLSPLSSAPLPPLGHPGLSFYNPYSGVYGKG